MRGLLVGVLSVLLLSVVPVAALAQEGPARWEPSRPGYATPDAEYVRRGRELRRIGIPVTLAGAVSVPVGIILASIGASCWSAGTCSNASHLALTSLGSIGIVGGVAALGSGIPLWVIGNYRIRRGMGDVRVSMLPSFGISPDGQATGRVLTTLTF